MKQAEKLLHPERDFFWADSFAPIVVKSAERVRIPHGESHPGKHKYFTMIYIKKGTGVCRLGDAELPLQPFDFILIKPEILYRFAIPQQEICELYLLTFSLESEGAFTDFLDFSEDCPYIFLSLNRKNVFANTLDRIIRERQSAHAWDDVMVKLLLTELLVLLSRHIREDTAQSKKNRSLRMKELLSAAKEYMDRNYSRNIALSDVAQYVYLSESHLAHSFQQEFGISPKHYLLQVRISVAKELLQNTRLKIGDIALAVGFSGQQRFNDIFKKSVHMTPLKYRKEMQQLQED